MSFILPFTAKHQGAQVEDQQLNVNNARAFTVTLGDSQDVVIAGNANTSVECKGLSAIASMAWARFVGNSLVRACFIKGRAICIERKFTLCSIDLVSHCVIQVNQDHLDISIEGTSHFSLETEGCWQKIVLDGKPFAFQRTQRSLAFTKKAGQWCLNAV